MMRCCGNFFGCNNDWLWIIIAIIVISCLCNEGSVFGGNNDCCESRRDNDCDNHCC